MDNNVINEIHKMYKGVRYIFPFGVLAKNVETDPEHKFLTSQEIKELKEKPGSTDPVSNNTVTFENVTNTRELLQSGTKLGKLFPQINAWLRWLNNLGTAAWKGVSNSTNVTVDGYVADSRALKTVNDKFGDMSFVREGDTIYVVYGTGADTVRKKLGNGSFGCLIDALGVKNYKDITEQYPEQDLEVYAGCAQYDLTVLDNYREIRIGEDGNTLVAVASAIPGQVYNYPATPFLQNQANFDQTIAINNIGYFALMDYKKYLPNKDASPVVKKCNAETGWQIQESPSMDYPVTYTRHPNFMLYNPSPGQLYHITGATIHSATISLYKIK